jgi:hypothetical protein
MAHKDMVDTRERASANWQPLTLFAKMAGDKRQLR